MNPKKRLLLTFVILLVAGITVIAALIYQNGKGYDEDTNRTEDMIPADRGMEENVSQDMLEMDQTKFQYSLPDGFYLEYEDSEYEDSGYGHQGDEDGNIYENETEKSETALINRGLKTVIQEGTNGEKVIKYLIKYSTITAT